MSAAASQFALPPPSLPAHERTEPESHAVPSPSELHLASPAVQERFAVENRNVTLRNARIGAWIVILLVPLCSVLDFVAYPDHFWQFLLLRTACSLVCVPLLLAIGHRAGKQYYRAYPILLPVIPAVFISLMIFLAADPSSQYYAGLTLCIVGASFVFNWTFKEIGFTLAFIIAVYLAATVPNLAAGATRHTWGVFMNNTAFILLNCIILFAASRHHHEIRMKEFLTRCAAEDQREELRMSNAELTEALRRLRETEAQLIQTEKLTSLDRLSAGIIHEINNPLNFAKSALFVLQKKCKKLPDEQSADLTRIVTDVVDGIDRVSSIVSDLRSFSHPDAAPFAAIGVVECVQKAVKLLRKDLHDHGISLEADIEDGLQVFGNKNHLIQILLNLMQNSIAALDGREQPVIEILAATTASRVKIIVSDNGCGIDAEHLPRIFDPFFTTKQVGQGMGLGLNLCYRMMKQMAGSIEADSQAGSRTRFTLWFPLLEKGGAS